MSVDLIEWQERADKISGLLKGDASTRQQAISLLDSLADLIGSVGAGGMFTSMFMFPNTVECTFAWMQEMMDDMSWRVRRDFQQENLFWPLYNIMHRIFPKMALELHPTFGLKPDGKLPDFLFSPNSVKDIVVLGDRSCSKLLTNAHRLDGVQSISFQDSGMFSSCCGNLDITRLGEGSDSFRIVSSYENALLYEVVEGKRQVHVATGCLYERYKFSLQEHPYLQVADIFHYSVENMAEVWKQTTRHSVLVLGIVRLNLAADVEGTIAERVVSISLVNDRDDAWCDSDGHNYIEQVLGNTTFPLLREVKGDFRSRWDEPPGEIKITDSLLRRTPELRTICFLVQSVHNWTISFDDCHDVRHPLSNIVVESNEDVIFYLFDTSDNQPMKECLKAISVNAIEALKNQQQRDFLSGASFVHLFQTDINMASIRLFDNLEALHVEREPYFVLNEMRRYMSDSSVDAEVLEINEVVSKFKDRFVIPKVPAGTTTDVVVVQSLSEVQFYSDKESFSTTATFLSSLREHIQEQSFPTAFVTWLQVKGVLRVGHYCLWVNGADVVRMKAYQTWGEKYLMSVKAGNRGGTLNLERLMFGLPQGVQNLLPLSMKSIRYNDPAIPLAGLLTISNLVELYVEIPVDVEDVGVLQNLEVLYLNDLALTELPESIGDLMQLRELHLWGNELSVLPDSIHQLHNLRVINISSNAFTGIPESLLSLPNLQRVIWRGGTDEWKRALDGNAFAAKRVEDGELTLYDASW